MTHNSQPTHGDRAPPTGFTRETQRKLTAMRVVAYSLASLFMVAMAVRGVWVTRNQMEAEVDRSVGSAASAVTLIGTPDVIDSSRAALVLDALSPPGVVFEIKNGPDARAAAIRASSVEVRTLLSANRRWSLVAIIDHTAIWQRALGANLAYMAFILALGLPVIAIFLYMGWLVNRPALQLLVFAQAGQDDDQLPPKLPVLWDSVLARLQQLRQSQAQMQAFLDHVPLAMNFIDAEGRVAMINRFGAAYYEQSPEQLVGKDWSFFSSYFADTAETISPLFIDPLTKGKTTVVETAWHGPQDDLRQFKITSFPVTGLDGTTEFIGMFFLDVTEERSARAEVVESRATLKAFFNHVPAAMYLKNLDNEYILINDLLAAQYLLTPADMIGHQELGFLESALQERIRKFDAHILATKEPVIGEFRFAVHDGYRDGLTARFPILNPEGEITHIGGIIFDVTGQRKAEEEVARTQETLHQSEKLAALGQLLAGVAHELNNPLAIVLGRAAILKDKLAGSPHAESIQKLRDAADRCARIVRTFLAMARQTGPRRDAVQINELVEGALDMTAYSLRTAEIELVQELDPALPMIEADEDQIVQLLINLIVNAQHALEGHGGKRRLNVSTLLDEMGHQVVIEVADTGPGVHADVAARIFEPFFTTKDVGAGTGLGLSVCKGMVEAHGGTLTLHETPGGGATFRATLPLVKGITRVADADEQAASSAKGHVLIVDDEPEIAAILADCLTPLGLTCGIAGDGHSALKLIASTRFDAIFCDVRMPGMDGISFYAKITAEHPRLATRLAFVSGDVLHRDLVRLKAASDRPIIEKPFDPQLVRDIALLLLASPGDPQ